MGLEFLAQPSTEPDAGLFNLPPSFDRKENAAKWVAVGHAVGQAQQRENLVGAGGVTADGWAVFKVEGKPHKAATSKGEFVLMFRPRAVQDAVNAVYGNVGKKRMMAEKQLAATSTTEQRATGMLSDEQLAQAGYRDPSTADDGSIQLNRIDIAPRVTKPTLDVNTP